MSHNDTKPTLKQTLDAMGMLLGWQQQLLVDAGEQLENIQPQAKASKNKCQKASHSARPAKRGKKRQG